MATKHAVLLELESLATSTDVEAAQAVLEKAERVGLNSCLATAKLQQRLPVLIIQVKLMATMRKVEKVGTGELAANMATGPLDYDDLLRSAASELVANGLDQNPSNWLPEVDGAESAKSIMPRVVQLSRLLLWLRVLSWQLWRRPCAKLNR